MAYYIKNKYPSKRRRTPAQKIIFSLLIVCIIIALIVAYVFYSALFKPNVWTKNESVVYINIPTGSDFKDLKNILYEKGLIINRKTFEWLAHQRKLDERVIPGRYRLISRMSNLELIRMLSGGHQVPVELVFNNIRSKEQLASRISQQLEADSAILLHLMKDNEFLKKYGLNSDNVFALFIPNTYEFWWNTSAESFMDRMYKEHKIFWDSTRREKARRLGLSIPEVVTLASIIEQETNKNDEKSRMAGVYINRLKLGWPLQADPTLKFALGDWSIKRVMAAHKEIDSPYNTYKYKGLPPGPICIPSIASIDAVLNAEKNNYLFFCAREDMSGYHYFTASHEEHQKNAQKYRQALNRMGIY